MPGPRLPAGWAPGLGGARPAETLAAAVEASSASDQTGADAPQAFRSVSNHSGAGSGRRGRPRCRRTHLNRGPAGGKPLIFTPILRQTNARHVSKGGTVPDAQPDAGLCIRIAGAVSPADCRLPWERWCWCAAPGPQAAVVGGGRRGGRRSSGADRGFGDGRSGAPPPPPQRHHL